MERGKLFEATLVFCSLKKLWHRNSVDLVVHTVHSKMVVAETEKVNILDPCGSPLSSDFMHDPIMIPKHGQAHNRPHKAENIQWQNVMPKNPRTKRLANKKVVQALLQVSINRDSVRPQDYGLVAKWFWDISPMRKLIWSSVILKTLEQECRTDKHSRKRVC
jgi:hypothetical protein